MNIYLRLTQLFNAGKKRAVICSGQATVLHRIAIMSKDGDWIVREDESDLKHILSVLEAEGAVYRFGAPLDRRWLQGGWSSHLEFMSEGMRVRTDFFSRPPRISPEMLSQLWARVDLEDIPVVTLRELAEQKTMREKDYAVLGAVAELMTTPEEILLYSRDALTIMDIAQKTPSALKEVVKKRQCLSLFSRGREALEEALDKERRQLMRADEKRLTEYAKSAASWQKLWPSIIQKTCNLNLTQAHEVIVNAALSSLPFKPTM